MNCTPKVRQKSFGVQFTIGAAPYVVHQPLKHRTDGIDTFDTLYIGCDKFPSLDSFHNQQAEPCDLSINNIARITSILE